MRRGGSPLVCEIAERILRPGFAYAGACTPGEVLDAQEVLLALEKDHLTLHVHND